jgi:hypothetical protein
MILQFLVIVQNMACQFGRIKAVFEKIDLLRLGVRLRENSLQ